MSKFKVPESEIVDRVSRLQLQMQENNIDGILIVQRIDLFYFSGTAQTGFMYIPCDGEAVLFIRKYYPRAKEESSVANIIKINSVKQIPGLIIDHYKKIPKVMGFELDVLPVNDFYFYRTLFKLAKHVDISSLIFNCRMIKSEWEIKQMEITADMSALTFEHMKNILKPGLSEIEFAGMCELFARRIGHGAMLRVRHYLFEGYPWHVLSGKSGGLVGMMDTPACGEGTSPAFPCGAGPKLIEAGEPVMVDFGSVKNGYHIDETRMFSIGKMPEKAKKACNASIEIHNAIIEKAKPGESLNGLYEYSVQLAKSKGYEEQYLGPKGYKVSFIAHGTGLELVEPPYIAKDKNDILQPGMTLALEPKIMFQNEFSAGVESVFVVTETGSKLLSKVQVEIFEI